MPPDACRLLQANAASNISRRRQGIPAILRPALLQAEANCRMNAGDVVPIATIDPGRLLVKVPDGCEKQALFAFLWDALMRSGKHSIQFAFPAEDDSLWVIYMDRDCVGYIGFRAGLHGEWEGPTGRLDGQGDAAKGRVTGALTSCAPRDIRFQRYENKEATYMDQNWKIGKMALVPDGEAKVYGLVNSDDGRIGCYEAQGRRGPLFFMTRQEAQKFGSAVGWEPKGLDPRPSRLPSPTWATVRGAGSRAARIRLCDGRRDDEVLPAQPVATDWLHARAGGDGARGIREDRSLLRPHL